MNISAVRRLEWDAAHRVMRHESKCGTLHGHRYAAELWCVARQLDAVGRVIDFGVVKEIVGGWIDSNWDHTTLINKHDDLLIKAFEMIHRAKRNEWVDGESTSYRASYVFDGEPTAENIGQELLKRANELLETTGVKVTKVRIYETPNCFVDVEVTA